MAKFTIGKYVADNTFIHNIDPRIKIISMLVILMSIFIPAGFIGYTILTILVSIIIKIAKLKFKFIIKAIRPMLFMMIFLLIINIFTIKTGDLVIEGLGVQVYSDSILQTLYIAVRLVLMIMITTVLTSTTKPLDLTLGIEDLLGPLKVFKVPSHEIAMMISIALRFIPTLIEEAERILKAQSSRGMDLKEGKLKEKVMAILSLIVPLFVSSLQRAEDLAYAMESRGYYPGRVRTRYRQLTIQFSDVIVLVNCFCVVLVMWIIACL